MPFDRKTGKPIFSYKGEDYTSIAREYILNKAKLDDKFMVITPNMPGSFALSIEDRNKLGEKFVDVGIAEEQAIAMASGAAKRGAHPLVITNTTFMQRCYDQISHDVCINNSPVTILLNYSSFDGLTDVTHLGIFGISIFSNIPNLLLLCPTSKNELLDVLEWSINQEKHPVMILMPGNDVTERNTLTNFDNINKYKLEQTGKNVAIIALGDFYQMGEELSKKINNELGFLPTLINPLYASGIDNILLDELLKEHKLVITLEDGILDGGFGEKIASYYGDSDIKVKNFGLKKKFYDRYNPLELLKEEGMDTESIINYIKENI